MKIARHFTLGKDTNPATCVRWKQIDVKLKDDETGKIIYEFKGVTIPEQYSTVSANILVGKYFRLTGVPSAVKTIDDETNKRGQLFPEWLRRRVAAEDCTYGAETHALQVFTRLAGFWAYWGWMYGYFNEESDARAFYDETIYMLANQIAAPNTPQWFNSGIYWAYGITGEPKGYWRADPLTGELVQTKNFYEFPGIHACHLVGISDHLFGPNGDGIYDNIAIETRCFAQGGGAGTNFSNIRSKFEKMSNGNRATGLMSFLRVFDRSAGVIKSGSSQRRSSKMVIVDVDHPEIEEFINWKMKEEEKVDALVKSGYDSQYEGEAYQTVSGQNANNSVRIPGKFMGAVEADAEWELTTRTTGETLKKVKARKLWGDIVKSAWRTGDPGVQFDDAFNDWNTCSADGRLTTTNPCLSGETWVHTDKGLRTIAELAEIGHAYVATRCGTNTRFVKADVYPTKIGQLYRLRMSNGSFIDLTEDHQIYIRTAGIGEFIRACDVESGMELLRDDQVLPGVPVKSPWSNSDAGHDDMFVAGLILGDGWIGRHWKCHKNEVGICFGNDDKDVLAHVKQYLDAHNLAYKVRRQSGSIGESPDYLRINNRQFSDWVCHNLKWVGHNAQTKRVPVHIMSATSEQKFAFLAGYFCADGTANVRPGKDINIRWSMKSEDLSNDVCILLGSVGVQAKLYRRDRKTVGIFKYVTTSGEERTYTSSGAYYEVIVNGDDLRRLKTIWNGSLWHGRKAELIEHIPGKVDNYGHDKALRVDSVTPLDKEELVYDMTVPDTHCFFANGILVHNCAEYGFITNTSCNLASLNMQALCKPSLKNINIHVESFNYACCHWLTVLDISNSAAQLPSRAIAEGTHKYRSTGLGHTGMGAVLMQAGIPYDSEEACHLMAVVTSLMTANAYSRSAQLAGELGAFPQFQANRASILAVIRKHLMHSRPRAADTRYWHIDDRFLSSEYNSVFDALFAAWSNVVELGVKHGFRNAFVTLIQPSGCISPDSMISTDRGLIQIGALGQWGSKTDPAWQDINIKIRTDVGIENATKFYVNGVQPIRRIRTARGFSLAATLNHRIRVLDCHGEYIWRRMDAIQKDDTVIMSAGKFKVNGRALPLVQLTTDEIHHAASHVRLPHILDERFAEFVGMYMGDGYVRKDNLHFGICFNKIDKEGIAHCRSYVEDVLGLHTWVEEHSAAIVKFCSVSLAKFMEMNGLRKDYSIHAFVPDIILRSPDRVRAAFLRGLFESDGSVCRRNEESYSVALSTASEKLATQVQVLLLDLGIVSNVRPMPYDDRHFGDRIVYEIRLSNRQQVFKFRKYIGFMTATKNNLLAAFKDNGDSNRGFALSTSLKPVREVFDELHGDARQKMRVRIKDGSVNIYYLARACRIANRHIWLADLIDNGAFFDSVQSVESSESFTLDITVPQTNTYIANGFVSHNTVGLLLGCDTLAIEPDFSIVKFKRLSGGGTMKIVNESLRKALENLGYTINQVNDILTYVLGHNTLVGAPHINRESLADAGIDKEDIEKIEKDIAGHVELRNAVSAYSLSDDSKQAIGLDKSDKNIFKRLGFSREQYAAANLWICGHGTLEGAPHIKAEHLPVFDCANRSGVGQRFIKPEAHVMAMAAVTPFISGAISKTVNMPNSATEADIDGIYKLSFKHGVKCMALYRDGCKRSQPLNNPGDISWWDESDYMPDSVYMRGQRKRPPKKRGGVTQEFKVFAGAAEHKVWIQTGEYEDGRLCEVWIDVSKENSDFRLAMKWWARAISNAVQYGQPLEEIAHSFVLEEGGPSGRTDHPYIVFCKSIPDLVLKWLSLEYLADTTWCRRRPPISELRCSQSKSALMDVGKRYQAAKKVVHRVDAPVLTVQKTHIDKCPICGSASIIPWPCPTCSSCGASLGGCSP